jgi:hypothetical protein
MGFHFYKQMGCVPGPTPLLQEATQSDKQRGERAKEECIFKRLGQCKEEAD